MPLRVFALVAALIFAQTASLQVCQAEEETELGRKMESIGDAYKALRQQLKPGGTPNATKCIELSAAIKANAEAAKNLEPARSREIPAAKRAAFIADFRKDIAELVATSAKLEAACKASKWDEARALMESLKKEKDSGHKEFKGDD